MFKLDVQCEISVAILRSMDQRLSSQGLRQEMLHNSEWMANIQSCPIKSKPLNSVNISAMRANLCMTFLQNC